MSEGATATQVVPIRHWGRWVAAAAILWVAAAAIKSVATNSAFAWSTVGTYLTRGLIIQGVGRTCLLTVTAMAIGIVGGVLLAIMRLSANPIISKVSWTYIWAFRGTPLVVQIIFLFNLAALYPQVSVGIPFGPTFWHFSTNSVVTQFVAVMLALGLNEAAYMAEIVRAGILSVDEGQAEAAASLGLTKALAMRRIVLPQAMRVIIPPTGNEVVSMLKTTSLAAFVAYPELLTNAESIYQANYEVIPLLMVTVVWYLLLTSVLYVLQYFLERRFARGRVKTDEGSRTLLRAVSIQHADLGEFGMGR